MPNSVPKDFKHFAKIESHATLLQDIFRKFPPSWGGKMYVKGNIDIVVPLSGFLRLGGIDAWIENQERQGNIYLWFKNEDDYKHLIDQVDTQNATALENIKHKVYRIDQYGRWNLSQSYQDKKRANFVGYDKYVEKISKDIENYKKHYDFLKSVGENKSLNYLFYGLPGSGKTTLSLLIASIFDYPIYVMNNISKEYSQMTPSGDQIKILLFEDFDRYLNGKLPRDREGKANNDNGYMSDVLNSLDGINSGDKIIRIFTGNDCKIIFENEALINRMACCFEFGMPTRDMYVSKFRSLLPAPETLDESKMDMFIDLVDGKVTLRPFVNYVIRYLFDEDYLDAMIANIKELTIEYE